MSCEKHAHYRGVFCGIHLKMLNFASKGLNFHFLALEEAYFSRDTVSLMKHCLITSCRSGFGPQPKSRAKVNKKFNYI